MQVSTADFKKGLRIVFDGQPYAIVDFQHVKPGKGGAFVRTKLKHMRLGKVIDNTFRSGEKVELEWSNPLRSFNPRVTGADDDDVEVASEWHYSLRQKLFTYAEFGKDSLKHVVRRPRSRDLFEESTRLTQIGEHELLRSGD